MVGCSSILFCLRRGGPVAEEAAQRGIGSWRAKQLQVVNPWKNRCVRRRKGQRPVGVLVLPQCAGEGHKAVTQQSPLQVVRFAPNGAADGEAIDVCWQWQRMN